MQFTVPQNTFKKAMTLVKRAIPNKSTLPILESVRLVADGDSVLIEGNNLDVALQVRVAADVDKPGEMWVNGKGLLALLKGKDPMMVHLGGEKVYIAKKGVATTMPAQDGSEWPAIPDIEITESIMLKDAMTQCAGFQSTEETRHFLNGIYIHGGKTTSVVAANGPILKAVRLEHSIGDCGLIIPSSSVRVLTSKPFPDGLWGIGHDERHVAFKSGDTTLISRRIEGEYPDYKSVVKGVKKEIGITTDRATLIEAVEDVAAIIPAKAKIGVRLEVTTDGLNVSAKFEDVSSSKTIDADGPAGVAFRVNPALFYACLNSIEADIITLFTAKNELSPINIKSEADEDTILMPMRGDRDV